MNYIYDILLNFNDNLYDTFEWNKTDTIFHVRKIPLFKINTKTMRMFLNTKVKFDKMFLDKTYKKTEFFNKVNFDYCFILSDCIDAIAFKVSKDTVKYSRLLPDEEKDTLEYSKSLKEINIDVSKIGKIKKDNFKTRNELKIKKYINKKINLLIKNNDIEKLTYLYLDCFNKEFVDSSNFIKEINSNWNNVYLKLYETLKLIETR